MGRHVLVTGAQGNLGQKLIRHLLLQPLVDRITGIDVMPAPAEQVAETRAELEIKVRDQDHELAELDYLEVDLRDWNDARWQQAAADCTEVVHLAAQVPNPAASWDDAAVSMDMNVNIGLAAVASPACRRLVFATTNHTMGQYKDEPLASTVGPGELLPSSPYGVGTTVRLGEDGYDSPAYAAGKWAGERLYRGLALSDQGRGNTEFVCIRIGWCNHGSNHPETLTPSGTAEPRRDVPETFREEYDRTDRWYKEMWLADRDFVSLFERAVLAKSHGWPGPYLCVNGMSLNTGMKWSLADTRKYLGYEPQEDVYTWVPMPE